MYLAVSSFIIFSSISESESLSRLKRSPVILLHGLLLAYCTRFLLLAALAKCETNMMRRHWWCGCSVRTRVTLTEVTRKKMSTKVARNVVVGVSQSRAASSRNRVQ